MADTDKPDPQKSTTDDVDREKQSSRPPRTQEGEGTADTEHPEDEALDLEEHLAGLWDVLGIGDEEEPKPEEEPEERKEE